jgi:hypothetical protein
MNAGVYVRSTRLYVVCWSARICSDSSNMRCSSCGKAIERALVVWPFNDVDVLKQ